MKFALAGGEEIKYKWMKVNKKEIIRLHFDAKPASLRKMLEDAKKKKKNKIYRP